jgi:hypothetical protein
MQEGIYAMYAGDADGNGRIQANDRNNFWRVQTNTGGYKSADFNLNGLVQANDRNNFWRTNSNRSTLVPN